MYTDVNQGSTAVYHVVRLLILVLTIGFYTPASAERTIVVDFTEFTLTTYDSGEVIFTTPVVLPRGDYYPVPVSGTVSKAEMGPVWVPTDNMHRDYPGRYKQRYGPYEPGNAMGDCKITIDFDGNIEERYPILKTVRIHGNAQSKDLATRVSRSCVRIPDALCPLLVEAARGAGGPVLIEFVR